MIRRSTGDVWTATGCFSAYHALKFHMMELDGLAQPRQTGTLTLALVAHAARTLLHVIAAYIASQGQVKELDGLAHTFMAAAPADRKALLTQAQSAADAVDTSGNPDAAGYVEYYIKTMQRVMDKGDAYIEQVGGMRCYCLSLSSGVCGETLIQM
jgi:CelD/BcsL family acetyltransferase involved in cellulose biosynthesis